MEASALKHASRSGLLARRSPLLRLQNDERLVALIRAGNQHAFEVLFDRYHARLLAFCRNMLRSNEDAEDVLQEVFANAHTAMISDERPINVRPWLYRIARNRCLNFLRKPVPEGQDSMDVHPHAGGATTADQVQTREDFRALVADVQELPETQRAALLLREIDALSYEEIAASMDTTVPAVKSLLVRARMSLAEASQSRHLTCGEVRLELAEAAEGLRKASGPVRHHLRQCEPCREYRSELRASSRELAALAPAALLVWLHTVLGAKLLGFGSGSVLGGSAAATGAGAAACGSGAAAGGATLGAAAAGGAASGVSGALGAKAAAGLATAALLTAGAVEVKHRYSGERGGGEAVPTLQQAAEPKTTPPPAMVPLAAGDAKKRDADEQRSEEAAEADDEAKAEAEPTTESSAQNAPAEEATNGGAVAPATSESKPAPAEPEAEASGSGTPAIDDEPAEKPTASETDDGKGSETKRSGGTPTEEPPLAEKA